MDLAFTDPDYYAMLKSWSLRGAPVAPVQSARPARRRKPPPIKGLFE
jgi:hypothetical protein